MKQATAVSVALVCVMAGLAQGRQSGKLNSTNIVTTKTTAVAHAHTNRLAREKSPYLLQHQYNPVDWHAWGEEAFAKARKENKPLFLSIGYSTCHWCHVMERESFENEETAAFLNEHFVSIKVDREERPDVDKIYMTFIQATTGQGGWPLNVFLTPDLKPFFGGTYFPPDERHGRPSFVQVLKQIDKLWETRHGDLTDSAAQIHARMTEAVTSGTISNLLLTSEVIRRAGAGFKQSYDARHGGFGGAPKFPQPSQPQFLLRYARRFKDEDATRMVLETCDRMAAGGIHDQLGGGFARYSVDAEWLVPHFEKMLYDNAQLAQLYLDAYLVSGDKHHAETARDILDYVLHDMAHPDGGFYSAEDADSEGHEGKFYCWTREELSKLLKPDEFKVAVRYFGITEKGNFVDHSHPTPLPNQNVLSIVNPLSSPSPHPDGERGMASELRKSNISPGTSPSPPLREERAGERRPFIRDLPDSTAAEEKGESTDRNHQLLASAKKKMIEARSKRVRPHLDDKVLASWNGLMLGAMARASVVLDEARYRIAAEKNLRFLQTRLWDNKTKTLYHRWRDGERDQVQLLEAYAFLLSGVLDLYEATLDSKDLDFALSLAKTMLAKFYDPENGGFWQSAAGSKDLILRVKEDYDGAEPSGNSVAILALLKLGKITDRKAFTEAGEKSLRLFADRLERLPQAVPYMLQALDFSLEEPKRAVVAGDASQTETRVLAHAIQSVYQPNKVVLGNTGAVEDFARTLPARGGSLVYICTGTACQAPTSDAARIRILLK